MTPRVYKKALKEQIGVLTAKLPSLGLEASNATSGLIVALGALIEAPAKASDIHKKMALDRLDKLSDVLSRSE